MPCASGEIVLEHGVAAFDAPPVAHADLLGGGDDLDAFPGAAERAQAADILFISARARTVAAVTSAASQGLMPYS
jgi:hypothetical protein